jgi:uncharacterized protein (TIGR02594 family)
VIVEPPWLLQARSHMGLRETKGPKHSAEIVQFWRDIRRGGIKDDETPWCAAFVGSCLEKTGFVSTRFESASSYRSWGVKLDHPEVGAIAVMARPGGAHVFFVVGRDAGGDIVGLGGNQQDEVRFDSFARGRIQAYRWPLDYPPPQAAPLPPITASRLTRAD